MRTKLTEYQEHKTHRLLLIFWRLVGEKVFLILPNVMRISLLRLFGARVGSHCLFYRTAKIFAPWNLIAGDAVCLGPRAEIYNKGRIQLGSGIVVSQDAYLCTASHDISDPRMGLVVKSIIVGDDVWIAAKASILPGVTIGEGSVVGACAVVAKDVAAWSVVVGNPARIVKKRCFKEGTIV